MGNPRAKRQAKVQRKRHPRLRSPARSRRRGIPKTTCLVTLTTFSPSLTRLKLVATSFGDVTAFVALRADAFCSNSLLACTSRSQPQSDVGGDAARKLDSHGVRLTGRWLLGKNRVRALHTQVLNSTPVEHQMSRLPLP